MMSHIKLLFFFSQVLQICTARVTSLVAQNGPLYFYSSGFPSDYESNTNDTWLLRAISSNYVVSSQVIATYLEFSPTCQWDNVSFYDGDSLFASRLGFFCGYDRPWIISSGEHMTVHFLSDSSVQKMGFKVKYWCDLKSGEGISAMALRENEFRTTGAMLAIITLLLIFAALGVVCYNKLPPKSFCVHRTSLKSKIKSNKVNVAPI